MERIIIVVVLTVLNACVSLDYLEKYEGAPPEDEVVAVWAVLNTYWLNDGTYVKPSSVDTSWIHEDFIPGHEDQYWVGASTGCGDIWVTTGQEKYQAQATLAHELLHCYLSKSGRGLDGDHSDKLWVDLLPLGIQSLTDNDLLNWNPDIYGE